MGYIGAGISRFNTADELTVTGDAEFNGNANFGDSDKAQFGAGNDLQIYHDGSNSYIDDAGAGDLFIRASNNHYLRFMNGDYAITTSEDGDVGLRYDNSQKLVTTSSGVDVTGTVTATTFQANAGGTFTTASGNDLNIVYPDSRSLFIKEGSTTHVTVNNVGNVGISNTAPDFNLSVGNSSSVNPSIQIMSATNSNAQLLFGDGAGAAGYRGTVVYGNATDSMSFSTAGGERMRLDSSGNLLVGKTADNVATVGIEARATGPLISTRDGSDALRLNRLNSDGEIIQLRKDGTVIGSIGTQNWGIGTSSPSFGTTSSAGLEISHATRGIIRLEGNSAAQALELYGDSTGGTIDARGSGAALQFDLGGSEKARFDSSGRLLISTTSLINNDGAYLQSNGGSNLAFGFNVNYDGTLGRFYRSSSIVGSISVTTSSTAYNTSSDRRLKSNIQDAESASDKIDAIQVRQFDWNADDSHQDYGLIAQELQPIEPMAVTGDADSDEMMGVDYSKLVPMLIKEIQELRSRVAALEAN